ncbi:type II toxin-antitoxin system RelE/ParE family toxin [Kitasatospora arboriphila]
MTEPYVKRLEHQVFELRPKAFRITFLVDDARHTVVMLTAFRKTRDNDVRQKERAYRAAEQCLSHHSGAREHDVWSRTTKGGR